MPTKYIKIIMHTISMLLWPEGLTILKLPRKGGGD